MADPDVKREPAKQLGRIALRRRPVADIARPEEPESRRARLVGLSEMYGVPALDLEQVCLDLEHLGSVPRSLAAHHVLVPVLARPDRLFVAMQDPSQQEVIQEVEFVAGKRVYAYAAPSEDIARTLQLAYAARDRGETHFVGPACPEETLRKAGLDPAPPAREVARSEADATAAAAQPAAPVLHVTFDGAAASTRLVSLRAPAASPVGRDSGPPATVSAFPPRPSPPPPGAAESEAEEGEAELLAAIEDAFDLVFEEATSVGLIAAESEPLDRGQKTIVVVDDEPEVLRSLERILGAEGYQVRTARNGLEALREVKERTPDVLVLDAMLPEVHGFEIARRLRSSERYRDLPIVMVSAAYRGWSFADELRDGCGVEHYVAKPFRPEAVCAAVAAALAERGPDESELERLAEGAEQALADGMEAFHAGRVERAIEHLEGGVQIDPLAYRLHFNLGLLLAHEGRTYDAIRALERAAEINPQHFQGLKNLAIMYGRAGFRNRAVELWRQGLALAPDSATRQAVQRHLAGLLSQESHS